MRVSSMERGHRTPKAVAAATALQSAPRGERWRAVSAARVAGSRSIAPGFSRVTRMLVPPAEAGGYFLLACYARRERRATEVISCV